MWRNVKRALLVALVGSVLIPGSTLFGATLKPGGRNSATVAGPGFNGNLAIRDLRTDFVRTWHIFADTLNDGILDPGDTRVGKFKNWWTPESAGTQHNHEIPSPVFPDDGSTDYASGPIDHQNNWTTNTTFGLPEKAGTIGFYMTYSVRDNADYETEFLNPGDPAFKQRNLERNGYAMGWLASSTVDVDPTNGISSGEVKMDIFIHKGKEESNYNFGAGFSTASRSDPQVAQSNEMSLLARQDNDLMLVPDYRDELVVVDGAVPSYDYGVNPMGYAYDGLNKDKYLVDGDYTTGTPVTAATAAELTKVVDSMDVREVNSYDTSGGAGDALGGVITAITAGKTPQELLDAGVKDGLGNAYYYEDSFFNRDGLSDDGAPWIEGSTDGGVIAGLSGFDDYSQYVNGNDPKVNTHWGEQQVIRIDIGKETLASLTKQGIKEIIFYDWGDPDAVTGQQAIPNAPAQQIVINVNDDGDLYFDSDGSGDYLFGTDLLFPDNIIYIAQVEHAPEPGTMILLLSGASAVLARRRRRRKLASI
ncbi:MAG: PEP-CTERM sorting domain-containing protein [bacterium]|nr:PEP-CTERM sorting domain-containing protein [bacterium]